MTPQSPEQWIRKYLLEHHGTATVPVHNLLTTWHAGELDADAVRLIGGALAGAGIAVDPPLIPGAGPNDLITLYTDGSDAALTSQPEPPPDVSAVPERIRLQPRRLPPTPPAATPTPPAPTPPVAEPQGAGEAPQGLRRRPPRPAPRLPADRPPPDRPAGGRLPSGYALPPDYAPSPGYQQPSGDAYPSGHALPSGYGQPSEPAAAPAPLPAGPPMPPPEKVGPLGGITLRMDLNRLRRRHDEDLRAFGSLLFELYRVGSERPELVADWMAELQANSDQILTTEEALGLSTGGVCPGCGLYCSDSRVCLACGREIHAPSTGAARRMSLPVVIVGVAMLTAAWLFGGLGSGDRGDQPQQQRAAAAVPPEKRFRSIAAHVRGPRIGVYRSPGARRPSRRLSNPNIDGAELVFLIKRTRGDWAYVYLPSRPNGSMGWIKLSDVRLSGHDYRLTVDLGKRTIKGWKGSREILDEQVGVGRAVTPTPTGRYYITDLLKQPDPGGTYGPYAFGLSGHSNVLNEFAGGDATIGIHGTDTPQAVGTDVSHGCIRVYNRIIRKLARTLPVGTPVKIQRT